MLNSKKGLTPLEIPGSKKNCTKSLTGLTLVELIAAALIMALGIVAIMRLAPRMLQTYSNVERISESVFLATEKLEEVKGKILENFNKAGGYAESATAFPVPHDNYRYSITDDLNANIKTISVGVWHIDSSASPVVFYTRVARRQ